MLACVVVDFYRLFQIKKLFTIMFFLPGYKNLVNIIKKIFWNREI